MARTIEDYLANPLRTFGSKLSEFGGKAKENIFGWEGGSGRVGGIGQPGGLYGEPINPVEAGYGEGAQPMAQQQYQPTPTQSEYEQPMMPTATPTISQQPVTIPEPEKDIFEFPAGDKPPIPEQHRAAVSEAPNSSIVASVIAQETGGYGYLPAIYEPYQVFDPEKGKEVTKHKILEIVTDWEEARRRKVVGLDGEVGIAQIIPKWHWQNSGYESEEAYADALYDPNFSIAEAGRILNEKFSLHGDWVKALNEWNKGPNYPKDILGRIGVRI